MSDHNNKKSDAQQSWASFCSRLSALGDVMLADTHSAPDQADALRLLGRHLATALDWHLTIDPDYPRFTYINNKGTSLAHEDMCQLAAPVRGGAAYRIHGNVSGLFDINISVHDGPLHASRNWGNIGLDELDVDADGNFSLIVSRERVAGNWIDMRPEAAIVSIRQYCYDWARHRPAAFEIDRIGSENSAPARPTPEQIAARLTHAADHVTDLITFAGRVNSMQMQGPANTLSAPAGSAGGSSHVYYGWGHYDLRDDEALVIEFAPPRAQQWSVEWLVTPLFIKSDMINRQTSLNGCSAHIDGDGRVHIVVSASDPGVQNWLDIDGYPQGLLSYRWIRSEDAPQPSAQRVLLQNLRATLPADTPAFGANERAQQRAMRRRQMAWRGR
jgi:hypothetical protein